MTTFYIKTDLDVAGPFTGIEIREASLAGIIRPQTFLSNSPQGPWLAAGYAGLFSEKATPLPHPPGTEVPTFQTRGMPGAFMGPFKLRELIGFACQGMLPPDAELQSDPSRPWIPITGTGILPACLRGDLVRIDSAGKLVLRTLPVSDANQRRLDLQSLQSPIQRAIQVRASGATANPLRVQTKTEAGASPEPPPVETAAKQSKWFGQVEPTGPPPELHAAAASKQARKQARKQSRKPARKRRSGGSPLGAAVFSRLQVRPQIAASVIAIALFAVAVPVAYSAWQRIPIDRQGVLGQWTSVIDENSESASPRFGVSLSASGKVVFMNTTGDCWTGDFLWRDRADEESGFQPGGEMTISFADVSPHHVELPVRVSDGYLRLDGLVKDPPPLDGQPVEDLFVRVEGERLWIGYPSSTRWSSGRKTLLAGWLELQKHPTQSDVSMQSTPSNQAARLLAHLRDLPEDQRDPTLENPTSLPIAKAVDAAIEGRNFDFKGVTTFRNGAYAHSNLLNAAMMLKMFGVADEARTLRDFEKPRSYDGPSFDGAQMFRYGNVTFVTNPEGKLLYVAVSDSTPLVG